MTSQPMTAHPGNPQRPEAYLTAAARRIHLIPTPGRLARRRVAISLTKWLLPLVAVLLLSSIALWPEFRNASERARAAGRMLLGQVESGQMIDPHYHGVDEKGRPFTVTASVARQVDADRVDLTNPKGDTALENGSWLMLQSQQGVYRRATKQLDLSHDVILYKDDGTTLTTQTASVDLQNGAAAGGDAVHAEGPFGVLDATGFTIVDKGAVIQFSGPAHVVLNGSNP